MSDAKAALLAAAKQLIAENGYAGTSVRDLAAASGTNLAAVNYHFGSRERLLTQAVLEGFLEWTDEVSRLTATQADAPPAAQLLGALSAVLDGFEAHEAQFSTVLEAVLQARRSPELRDQLAGHYAEQRRRVGAMVSAGAGGAEIPEPYLSVLASVLIAVSDGLLLQSILDPEAIPTGEQIQQLARAVTPAPSSDPTPSPKED